MFFRISTPLVKSFLRTHPIYSYRSAFRIRNRKFQIVVPIFSSRPAATTSGIKVPPVPGSAVPKKPSSAAVSRSLAPDAAEVQDARQNLLAQTLAQQGNVKLFQAASHTGFMCMAWIGGVICFGGTLIILNQRLYEENKELPWFVPGTYRIVAVCLVALGGWSIARSSRLISSIEILPGNDKARLLFKIRRNIPLPLIKPKEMIVHVSDVSFQRRVVAFMGRPPPNTGSWGNLDKGFIIGIAGRISAALLRFFAGARQFIFSDGIIKVSMQGQGGIWKLDSNGLFHDGGRPLFEMVKFEYAPEGRRYGEPDWESRPVQYRMYGGTGLFGDPGMRDARDFPKYTEQSYEEWMVEGYIEIGLIDLQDESKLLAFKNPLVMLQGSTLMIEVVVGKEAAIWCLHEKVLAAGSTFFKAAMNSPFKEGSERKISLAEDGNLVFQLFVQHLYTKAFHTSSMSLLLKAYALGDKLGAPDFQAQALDKIFGLNYSHCQFTAEQVLWVFENTLPKSGLRRLTADTVAHATLRQRLNYGKEDWEILAPVMPELMEGIISIAGVQDVKDKWSRKSRLAYQD